MIGLILGLLTRIATFGIACVMLVAVYMVQLQFGLFMNWAGTNQGEGIEYHLLVLAIAVMFVLMIKGGGALSVDRAISESAAASHASAAPGRQESPLGSVGAAVELELVNRLGTQYFTGTFSEFRKRSRP